MIKKGLNLSGFRVGVIVPSSNTTVEYEFQHALQDIATVHTARVWLERVSVEELRRLEDEAVKEAAKLATADVDVIVFGCTSGGFVKGMKQYIDIENKIKSFTGVECVSTAGAVLRALKHLGAEKICLITPYTSDITRLESSFLKGHLFEVVSDFSASIVDNRLIGRVEDEEVVRWVEKTNHKEADTIFISCTNLKTFKAIMKIEELTGKPTISSNSSTLWNVLNVLGISVERHELGRLFRH